MTSQINKVDTDPAEAPDKGVGCGALVGLGYRGSDGAMTCLLCDFEMEWRDCDHCCGDGYLDGYEEDPINFAPGEDVTCHMCGGNGGEHICQTKDCKTVVCTRVVTKPNTPREPMRSPQP